MSSLINWPSLAILEAALWVNHKRDDREYWDGCHGEVFYDWYLEMLIESAYREPEQACRVRHRQPLLPGLSSLSLGDYYGLE